MNDPALKQTGEGKQDCAFIWKVDLQSLENASYCSGTFWAGEVGMCEGRWQLQLNPYGSEGVNNYVSLILCLVFSTVDDFGVNVVIKVKADPPYFSEQKLQRIQSFSKKETRCSFVQALSRDINQFISIKTLTIECELSNFNVLQHPDIENRSKYSTSPASALSQGLWKQYTDSDHVDTTVKVGDREFKVHKIVLAAQSAVFTSMFQLDMLESRNNQLTINDCDPEVFEEFICFIYLGKCDNLKQVDARLLAVAEKYDIQRLKTMCEQSMADNLSTENAVYSLLAADINQATWLKRRVLEFIECHALEVFSTEGWKSLMSNSALLNEVFVTLAVLLKNLRG